MKKIKRLLSLIMVMSFLMTNSLTALGAEGENLGRWTIKAELPTAREQAGVATVSGMIYVIGGLVGIGGTNAVDQYDPITDTWTTKASMPTGRSSLGVAVVNDKIYAIGGFEGRNVVEEYNPTTDTWTTKASMPTARYGLAVAEANGKIYAIGGVGGANKVEEYDPATDTWTTKTNMPTERSKLGLVVVNGKIYAIGGNKPNGVACKNIEVYDPVKDTWTIKANMPQTNASMGVAEFNGKIYVVGGWGYVNGRYRIINKVEEYDTVNETWITKAGMPTARGYLGLVKYDNKLYAIGGNDGSNTLKNVEVFTPSASTIVNSPINLTATASNSNIILNWDAVQDVDSYTILRATTSGSIDTVIATNITETTYIDNDVELGVTYYYVVRAVKDGVESKDSNIASAMIEENTNVAVLQIKLTTTDIYEYRMTMDKVDDFKDWYIARYDGTGLPFYSFPDDSNIEPYTEVNEYIIHDKIVWFKVKEYLQ